MHPILLEAGPVTIYSYGVLLAAAYLLGLWLGVRRANEAGLDGNRVMDLGIWVIIAALVGAKGLLFVLDFNHFTSSREEFMSLLRSGGVFYGGLIAASVTCIYLLRKHKLPLWKSGDLFAPGIALGYMVGRLGCLAAGCCYGRPAPGLAWAVTFTDPAAAMNVGTPLNVPLHPTQLYESLAGLVILIALLVLEKRGRSFPGRTFWQFVLMYAVSRFIIEFFRGDDRGMMAMFSTSQIISLVLAPLSLVMLWWLAGRAASPTGTPAVRKRRPA